ncbi:MAG: hypothetical protein JWQ71_2770 [Pedosphaera sp.]|nr:hypothetical protein [Pedosphaera sp.]
MMTGNVPLRRFETGIVEFLLAEKVIHVRSAARVGYYDFQMNRKRVESIRRQFNSLQP